MLVLRSLAVAAALALGVLTPGIAQAAPPANDDFGASTPVTTLPFSTQVDLAAATVAPDDPRECTSAGSDGHTVWFHHTATEDGLLRFGTTNKPSPPHIAAFTGDRGNLRMVENGCNWGAPGPSPITIQVTAGQTYHFMLSTWNGGAGSAEDVTVQRVQRLANDDFANAQNASGLFEAFRRADAAIGVAREFVAKHPETLLLTAADSDASGLQIVGLGRKNETPGEPRVPTTTKLGNPMDGVAGQGTGAFLSGPDRAGRRFWFGVTFSSKEDMVGGVVVRAEGVNRERLPVNLDNTELYVAMWETLFGKELSPQGD